MVAPVPLLHARNANQRLYISALLSAFRHGDQLYDPDLATANDPDIYERVKRDPVIAHAIEQRLHMIAGTEWMVVPGDETRESKLLARIVEDALRHIARFAEARYELAQAIITSRSFAYVNTEEKVTRLGGLSKMPWTVPTFLDDIDRRRIRLVPIFEGEGDERTLRTEWELYSIVRGTYERLANPEYFVKFIAQDEEARTGHGRGLLEGIYFYHFAKTTILREALQGIQRWAQGTLVAKIDGLREASEAKTNENLVSQWIDALTDMKARHHLIHDAVDEVTLLTGGMEGYQMVRDMLDYLDSGVTRYILGSLLPTGGGADKGSLARAYVEESSRELLIRHDQMLEDEIITRDVIGLFLRLNRRIIRGLGLGDAAAPRFETVVRRDEDPKDTVQIIGTALTSGVPLRKDEVYRKLRFSVPGPDDEIFERSAAVADAGLPGFGRGI